MPNTLSASKLMLRAAIVCIVSAISAAAVADDNRLKNPGGEEASKEDKSLPASWVAARAAADGLTMRLDDKVVRAGKASMFVGSTHGSPQAVFNNWAQRIEGLAAGESFTLSGWVKTESAEAASMCIQAWDEGGKSLIAYARTDAIIGTRDWQLVKTTPITIPQSAKTVIVRAGLSGKGKAWFDELRLSPGDGARYPDPPEEPGANLIANPGAEEVDPQARDEAAVWVKAQVPTEGLRMVRSTDAPRAGKAALHISNTHDYGEMVCNNWTQTIPYNLAGKVVKLSAWVRTEDAEHVSLCVQGFTDLVNMSSYRSTEAIKGTQGWRRIESRPVKIGKSVTLTTVRAVLIGRGKVWFDDLTLEIVEEDPDAE